MTNWFLLLMKAEIGNWWCEISNPMIPVHDKNVHQRQFLSYSKIENT